MPTCAMRCWTTCVEMRTSAFRRSHWFKRGWTLQELLAPHSIGSNHALAAVIHEITGIDEDILTHKMSLTDISVARRMSWASGRVTSRIEDQPYSLMGIFAVHGRHVNAEGPRAFMKHACKKRSSNSCPTRASSSGSLAWSLITRKLLERYIDARYLRRPAMHKLLSSSTRVYKACSHSHRRTSQSLHASVPSRSMTSLGCEAFKPPCLCIIRPAEVYALGSHCSARTTRRSLHWSEDVQSHFPSPPSLARTSTAGSTSVKMLRRRTGFPSSFPLGPSMFGPFRGTCRQGSQAARRSSTCM
ncbi:hypothetical protein BD413DRAFT_656692 [Trametes elegans]|nr:hypothetical protein BD413DRAFT_656692 [Trametes elegans]